MLFVLEDDFFFKKIFQFFLFRFFFIKISVISHEKVKKQID